MKISSRVLKYLTVLIAFLLVSGIVFIITLSYNVKISDYFLSTVNVTEINAGSESGSNNVYTMPLSTLTTKNYSDDNLKYYSTIEITGRSDKTSSVLRLRGLNFKVKSGKAGSVTLRIDYYDSIVPLGVHFNTVNLDFKAAGEEQDVSLNTSMKFSGITSSSKIKISVIAKDSDSVANPDNISFAIYNLVLKK